MEKMADYKDNLIDLNNPAIKAVLPLLLCDKTTGHNIIWATNSYSDHGVGYYERDEITMISLNGLDNMELQPRVYKSLEAQKKRTKSKAEVFTPSWICNLMNNHVNEQWFKRPDVFNVMDENHNWKSKNGKIGFKELKHTWQDYVYLRVIEITCGEAPYLVSRYDTVTGEPIRISKRIGMLDRKLRVVNENTTTEDEWFTWVKKAYQSTYGYEWQGDNLLIARINMLFTFIDYMKHKWDREPTLNELKEISKIIVWNIFQMDGLICEIPLGGPVSSVQTSIDEKNVVVNKSNYVIIKNWQNGNSSVKIQFKNLNTKGKRGNMKFDFCIGNPPYQLSQDKTDTQTQGNSKYIYQDFQRAADNIATVTCLIYPFGGWFDAPERLGKLGETILKDCHTVAIYAFEGTSDKRAWYRTDKQPDPIFGNHANLSAGVAVVLRDLSHRYKTFKFGNRIYSDNVVDVDFTQVDSLTPNPVCMLVNSKLGDDKLHIHIKHGIFGIESDFVEKHPEKVSFNKDDWENPIQLLTNDKSGSSGRATWFWTDKKYIEKGIEYLPLYKVVTTSAYPKKTFVSGKPIISNVKERSKKIVELLPNNSAFGRSRMLLFASQNEQDCLNFIKYTQTTFFAGLLLNEPNRSSTIGFIIPYLDFSNQSDIDWSLSIEKIDEQLYQKYKLNIDDIAFIEQTHINSDEEDSNEKND